MRKWAVLVIVLMILAGCSSGAIYQGIYEGARVHSQLQSTPSDRLGREELPGDYQRYDRMRTRDSSDLTGAPAGNGGPGRAGI